MRKFTFSLLVLLLPFLLRAQQQTVSYDYQTNLFNNNMPVPQGTYFSVHGDMPAQSSTVIFAVYKNHKRKKALYSSTWRRPIGNAATTFTMPANYKLRGNNTYDFVFYYYRPVTSQEREDLRVAISNNLMSYLNTAISANEKKMTLNGSADAMIANLNQIVWGGLSFYESSIPGEFPGFSDLVKERLENIDGHKFSALELSQWMEETDNGAAQKQQQLVAERSNLLSILQGEINPYLDGNLTILMDTREVVNAPTEKVSNYLALNAGWGATMLSEFNEPFDYGTAPYVGLSFPLGNTDFSKFWGNTAISVGVFLRNFKTDDGRKMTGPVVGLPYFVGAGYKFLHIFRAQAGVVALSENTAGSITHLKIKDFKVRPFVGISVELNLWLGFDKDKH